MATTNTETQTAPCIKAIGIDARRWFQKTYGNTYHSVTLKIAFTDGTSTEIESGKHYGYGEQWNQTALDMFANRFGFTIPSYSNGSKKFVYLTSFAKHLEIPCFDVVSDVKRQKDL